MCLNTTCASGSYCVGGSTCTSFPGGKCFDENAKLSFYDIGENWMKQNGKPDWRISKGGEQLSMKLNTRPSLGVSALGNPRRPVSLSGRVWSDNTDGDVIGMVFGFQDEKNFFVVASSRDSPGNKYYKDYLKAGRGQQWYVGRVHATCGESCKNTTTISDAIWWPKAHPTEITILATGTNYWLSKNKYIFSICFNPSDLLLSVTIDWVNAGRKCMETGTISAKTNKPAVDEASKKGGSIGAYVDSQQGTIWDELECNTCNI
jgi:hypothetical protein